jgi:hypothetical protein
MLNIVLADLFRLTKGKSTAIFLGVLSLVFTLLMMTTDITVSKFEFYLIFIVGLSVGSIAISISSVIRVYCDDVTSGSIHHLFANMSNKMYYLIAKSIVLALYSLFCYIFFAVVFFVVMIIKTNGFAGGFSSYIDIVTMITFSLKAYIGSFTLTVISYNILVLTRKVGLTILFIALYASKFIDSIVELFSYMIEPLNKIKDYMFPTFYMDSMHDMKSLSSLSMIALGYLIFSFIFQYVMLRQRDFATD